MRVRLARRLPCGLSVGTAVLAAAVVAAQPGSIVDTLLQRDLGFSADDLLSLDAGSAVIRSLDTPIREELAHVGVVYVDVPAERFLERFRHIEQFESGPGIPQIGRFGATPKIEDLAPLTLPTADVEALSRCRPGDCDVQLSAAAMDRFQTEVDWSSPNAAREADAVARAVILDLVRAYQADGNAALGYYDDGDEPLRVADEFRAILSSETTLPARVPDLLAYLDHYPHDRPAGTEDFFYWTVVDFGLKLTIRVNHVTIYPMAAAQRPGITYAIAIKQLYASHYFHTTLELRFLVDDDRRAGRLGASLVSFTRSRSDGMTGFKGLFLRPIISSRSRDAVRGYLQHVKRQVEHPARQDDRHATRPDV